MIIHIERENNNELLYQEWCLFYVYQDQCSGNYTLGLHPIPQRTNLCYFTAELIKTTTDFPIGFDDVTDNITIKTKLLIIRYYNSIIMILFLLVVYWQQIRLIYTGYIIHTLFWHYYMPLIYRCRNLHTKPHTDVILLFFFVSCPTNQVLFVLREIS